ncbi:MAG: hypothetical protein LBS92_05220 [Candidatus Methanoplasma sp.]|nr:hypothetical protein [Candidatus Methanoplasma sp.]
MSTQRPGAVDVESPVESTATVTSGPHMSLASSRIAAPDRPAGRRFASLRRAEASGGEVMPPGRVTPWKDGGRRARSRQDAYSISFSTSSAR